MFYLQKKDFVQCPTEMTRHTAEFVAALYKPIEHADRPISLLPAAAMETRRQPAEKRMRPLEQQRLPEASSDICPYWPASPSFDPHIVLLRRLFFINSDGTKYVSAGFYPARNYKPLVEFGAIGRGGSKSILLTD